MNANNLTSQRLPISEIRINACHTVAANFMDYLIKKDYKIDEYTNWFIMSIFDRILIGPKAYRVYDVFDETSQWHNSAARIIKEGTLHHMYLKDNNLQQGLVRDTWCKELLSTGHTKEEMVEKISDMICSKKYFLDFVTKMQIKRHYK